uniref:hypothetical protein n=1 Tax=Anaerosporobacter sp. TaxID=1872529 RepID=UPI00286F93E1
MVTNVLMKCGVCESVINLKWQVGHVEETPVCIICPECRTTLKFVLMVYDEDLTIDIKTKSAIQVYDGIPKYFAETSSELLTFKIKNQPSIKPGYTPFIRTSQMMGLGKYEMYQKRFLLGVQIRKEFNHIFQRINELYMNGNTEFLSKELVKYSSTASDAKSLSDIDITKKLYFFNISYLNKFFKKGVLGQLNDTILEYMKVLRENKKFLYDTFLINVCTDEKLFDYEKKLIRVINM